MFSDAESDDVFSAHKAFPVPCQSIMTPFPCPKQNASTETLSPISDVSNLPPSFPFYPLSLVSISLVMVSRPVLAFGPASI